MKKKSLVKCLGLMGLILADTSCEKQESSLLGDSNKSQSLSINSHTQTVGFTPIVELDLPDFVDNQIIALSTLAKDIFENPSVAQSFSNNPQQYLNSIGLANCNLDINSAEVKTLLALGDVDIRNAIANSDLSQFVTLLQEKNYISFDNNYISSSLENHLIELYNANPDLQQHLNEFP